MSEEEQQQQQSGSGRKEETATKHRRKKEEIEKDFICGDPNCGRKYGTNAALYTHIKNKHNGVLLENKIFRIIFILIKNSHNQLFLPIVNQTFQESIPLSSIYISPKFESQPSG